MEGSYRALTLALAAFFCGGCGRAVHPKLHTGPLQVLPEHPTQPQNKLGGGIPRVSHCMTLIRDSFYHDEGLEPRASSSERYVPGLRWMVCPPAASTEEGRQCQLPGDRADLITLQSATYALLHLVVTTGRLYRRAQSTAVPCHEPKMPHPDIRCSGIIPWYLPEVLRIETRTTKEDTALTMNELAAQAFVFFLAGFETSSNTMTFCLFELVSNPDIQEKLPQEVKDILDKYDNKLTYGGVIEMHYMEKVINETLRKYPPVPFLNRVCTKDYHVPGTDFIIEKGTKVMIQVLGIQRDPEHYPDPEKFDPERFSEENKKTRHPYTFLPFGEGPRICIGLRFGMMQTKVALTILLKNYKFSLGSKTALPLKFDPKSVRMQGNMQYVFHDVCHIQIITYFYGWCTVLETLGPWCLPDKKLVVPREKLERQRLKMLFFSPLMTTVEEVYLKNYIYREPINILEELNDQIHETLATVIPNMIRLARENLIKRVRLFLQMKGGHFEYLL
ncbi:hypothetical protein GEV33_009247 [Tenebrio molitor]|uniref:Cytochrome P450 monooxygenase n=1 Tax=Tenebrio molitor TaxID=7067 RepID=A0A8J6HH41_TENMO|nr:hypothetical protein GEV33_009247 [Tenebrio molitor]